MFLHSGSRGVGNKIARKHVSAAKAQCKAARVKLPTKDLAYLEEGTPEFDNNLSELHWEQRFAWLNREEMMDRFGRCLREWIGRDVAEVKRINCHHNYTVEEEHYGEKVWLTRKGAVLADAEPLVEVLHTLRQILNVKGT